MSHYGGNPPPYGQSYGGGPPPPQQPQYNQGGYPPPQGYTGQQPGYQQPQPQPQPQQQQYYAGGPALAPVQAQAQGGAYPGGYIPPPNNGGYNQGLLPPQQPPAGYGMQQPQMQHTQPAPLYAPSPSTQQHQHQHQHQLPQQTMGYNHPPPYGGGGGGGGGVGGGGYGVPPGQQTGGPYSPPPPQPQPQPQYNQQPMGGYAAPPPQPLPQPPQPLPQYNQQPSMPPPPTSVGYRSAPQMPPPPTGDMMMMGQHQQQGQGQGGALPAPSSSGSGGAMGGPAPPRTYPVSNAVPTAYNGASLASSGSSEPSPRENHFALSARLSPPGSARSGSSPYKGGGGGGGASSRIDPTQMPRPPRPHVGAIYETMASSRKVPPVVNTSMTVVDTGYCSPRFMRCTMAAPPCSSAMERECAMPLAFVATPFAPPEGCSKTEGPVPIVRSVDDNPVRCGGCRGYINPSVRWLENGSTWECNLCKHPNIVPDYYYSSLDGTGLRMDRTSRPELSRGTVDFQVSGDYCVRPIKEPVFIFAIDISAQAMQSGAAFASVQSVTSCINKIMSDEATRAVHAFTKVGIFTYNRMVQFYSVDLASLSEEGKVKMHVVDAWDPICAIPPAQWIKSITHEAEELQCLLDRLPSLIATEQQMDESTGYVSASMTREDMKGSCTGAAMKSACDALRGLGGKVIILSPHSPSIGSPKLSRREDMQWYSGPYEHRLHCSADSYDTEFCKDDEKDREARAAFPALAREASAQCLSYDLLLMDVGKPDIDTAVLCDLCDATGGSLHLMRGSISDEENVMRLERQVWHCMTRFQGIDAVVKVRVSPGLALQKFLPGKGIANYNSELELGCIDDDTTFSGLLKVDGSIADDEKVHIQLAVLYTDRYMRRMVRVHNLGLKATSNHNTVFRYTDQDALVHSLGAIAAEKALMVRMSAPAADGGPREYIKQAARDILYAYRFHCSQSSPPKKLIMPDSLKMLPLYTMGLLKHPAFIDNADLRGKCPYVRGMERAYELRRMRSLALRPFMNAIYPRLYALCDLDEAYFNGGGSDDDDEEGEEGGAGGGDPYTTASSSSALPWGASRGPATTFNNGGGSLAEEGPDGLTATAASDDNGGGGGGTVPTMTDGQYQLMQNWMREQARARGDAARLLVSAPRANGVCSESMQSDAVYLLDEGSTMYLYVGRAVSGSEIDEWFNVPPHANPRPTSVSFSADSHMATLMRTLVEALQSSHAGAACQPELVVVWADEPSTPQSTRLALRLVEDSIYGNMSYTDYLCKLHAAIQERSR